MCGITALSRAPQSSITDSRAFIVEALLAIETRGYDSTGVGYVLRGGSNVWYDKRVGPASKVARLLDLSKRKPIDTAIGHTRWSTKGAHTYDNAHPVVADNIVLAHNGVVANDDELVEAARLERVGQVDSWAIAAILAVAERMGATHVSEMFSIVEADAALAWLDADDPQSLHLARLSGRPMTLGFTRRHDLVMSSTRATLERTARATNTRIDEVIDVPMGTYIRVVGGNIVEWVPFGKGAAARPTTPPKPKQNRLIQPVAKGKGRTRHPKQGVLQPMQRGDLHGITDRFAANNDDPNAVDWWAQVENWPTGDEIVRNRPRNKYGW